MAGQWQTFSFPAANTQATCSVTSGTVAGQAIRLRALQAGIAGTGVGACTIVIRDGATGTGTIVWEYDLNNQVNSTASVTQGNMDIRATSGTMTIESTAAGGANTNIAINAQGDFCQTGAPYLGGM